MDLAMPWHPRRHDGAVRIGTTHHPKLARPSADERGYDWAWRKLRAAFAANHPAICDHDMPDGSKCGAALASRYMHLDHRKPKSEGGTDDEENLHFLCWRHHNEKSQRERRGTSGAR
jgi:5-methylcytosine-specific restriction enzyme A